MTGMCGLQRFGLSEAAQDATTNTKYKNTRTHRREMPAQLAKLYLMDVERRLNNMTDDGGDASLTVSASSVKSVENMLRGNTSYSRLVCDQCGRTRMKTACTR